MFKAPTRGHSIPVGVSCDRIVELLAAERGCADAREIIVEKIKRMQQIASMRDLRRMGPDYLRHAYGRRGPAEDLCEAFILEYIDASEPWDSILDSLKRGITKLPKA